MKKILQPIFIFISCAFCCSCVNRLSDNNIDSPETTALDKYKIYGNVHNQLLNSAYKDFIIEDDITSEAEFINDLISFQSKCIDNIDEIDDNDKNLLKNEIIKYCDMYNGDNLYNKAISQTRSNPSELDLNLRLLYEENIIDEAGYEMIVSLCRAVKANYEGEISVNDLSTTISTCISKWNECYIDVSGDNNCEQLMGIILAISKSSVEWWQENPESTIQTKALPAWAAADIVGAIVGATWNAVGQLTLNDEFSWASLGWATAGGAITGSTGAVSKIANIFKLLK